MMRALTQYGVLIYFVLTFALSSCGALIVLGPRIDLHPRAGFTFFSKPLRLKLMPSHAVFGRINHFPHKSIPSRAIFEVTLQLWRRVVRARRAQCEPFVF
jgi:hypothetical protein